MKIIRYLFLFFIVTSNYCSDAQSVEKNLLQSKYWKVEAEYPDSTFLKWDKNELKIDSKGGVTLWLNQNLKGHYIIEYDRIINLKDSYFLRVSDINQFWNAQLPNNYKYSTNGKFSNYDNFQMMYFGFGGNSNKTTRFRYYDGKGKRILLKEYLDKNHLIENDKTYHIKTEVNNHQTTVWINDILYFRDTTSNIHTGYFGLRLTWSTQTISNFKITKF